LSESAKLSLLCLLLALMLAILAFTSVSTLQAVKTFQHQATAVKSGDVSTIHPWMSIHVVSHIYYVPEDYLYSSLHISAPGPLRHSTLYQIANRRHQPVNQVIHIIQDAILVYRHEHPHYLTPIPTPKPGKKPLTPAPGGMSY
jgi:hypothetical protein